NDKEFIKEPTEKRQRKPAKNGEPTHRKMTNLPKKTDDESSEKPTKINTKKQRIY
ncbi:764_t:CDS:1, partial [Dentiscutata erythropus]